MESIKKFKGVIAKWRTVAILNYLKAHLENGDEPWRIIEIIDNYIKFVEILEE